MSEEKGLTVVEQKQVLFYDDEITAVLVKDGERREIFVALRQMCDLLGVSYQGQIRRINDDPVLSKKIKGVNITFTPSGNRGGGSQVTNCLPIDYLNGWLFGINANRVKAEVRDRLILYQENCYRVLAEAFQEGRLTADASIHDLLNSDSPAAQAFKMAQAIMQMARQQLLLESRLETHDALLHSQGDRLETHESRLGDYGQRLEEIETTLGNDQRFVTPDQAMQISQAIKTIAAEIQKRTGRNEYGKLYGQLYREFGITSYKQLPASKFNDAMEWLNSMYRNTTGATGDDLPF